MSSVSYEQVGDNHLITCAFRTVGKTKAEALSEAVRVLSDAMGDVCKIAPVPEVEGLYPLVLYFATMADAKECEKAILNSQPNLKPHII